jgi:uncharacterized cupin superfamily protein
MRLVRRARASAWVKRAAFAISVLHAGDCATFPKGTGNGHHMINKSSTTAVYLDVGSRSQDDLTTYSDIDMMIAATEGQFVHKDGTPYSK